MIELRRPLKKSYHYTIYRILIQIIYNILYIKSLFQWLPQKGVIKYMLEFITKNNEEYWENCLHPDIAENIGRKFYKGIMELNEENYVVEGFLIWENKNMLKAENNKAELIDFYAEDDETAKSLLKAYAQEAKREEIETTYFEARPEWNEVVMTSLRESGFELTEEETKEVSISIGELNRLPVMAKNLITPKIVCLGELSLLQLRNGILNCMNSNIMGDLEDLLYLSVKWYEDKVSSCVLTDGVVNGFLLVHKTTTGKLIVKLLYGSKQTSQIELLQMIQHSIIKGKECYDVDTQVLVKCCNNNAKELVKKLFQREQNRKTIFGSRREH